MAKTRKPIDVVADAKNTIEERMIRKPKNGYEKRKRGIQQLAVNLAEAVAEAIDGGGKLTMDDLTDRKKTEAVMLCGKSDWGEFVRDGYAFTEEDDVVDLLMDRTALQEAWPSHERIMKIQADALREAAGIAVSTIRKLSEQEKYKRKE